MLMTQYSATTIQYSSLEVIYKIIFCNMAVPLDDVDIQLLTALQEDADRTNVELARLAGLSPAATLHRVRRLKESGVIRVIRADLDPAAAGFPLQVYVTAMLARHDPRSSRVFDDLIRSLPQIIAADNVAGETDYLLTVVARDVSELQTVLAHLATHGGQRLVTYLRLEQVKPPSRLPLAPIPAAASRRGQRRAEQRRAEQHRAEQRREE
jgi:Lrp/AsnC family transcriptional regulator, leucine-responsive regulatory protein